LGELIFCKLGGSVLTDKQQPATPRPGVIARLAAEIAAARAQQPGMRLLLGHGSGSFGHVSARRYHVQEGIASEGDWWGYAETSAAAAQLNRLVTDACLQAGVPVVSIQPSASARCREGELVHMEDYPIRQALDHDLVPMVYGDVAFDEQRGCTIVSTEAELSYLASRLAPVRLILVGQVDGVYDADPLADAAARRIARITPVAFARIEGQLGGSHGVDVTGGMLSKVRQMVRLVERGHAERVHLVSGLQPGALTEVLLDPGASRGTLIVGADK
jgi:isopentenyl phosphate kinase